MAKNTQNFKTVSCQIHFTSLGLDRSSFNVVSVETGGIMLLKSAKVMPIKVRIESDYNQVRNM